MEEAGGIKNSSYHKKEGIHHKDLIVRNFSNPASNSCCVINGEEYAF